MAPMISNPRLNAPPIGGGISEADRRRTDKFANLAAYFILLLHAEKASGRFEMLQRNIAANMMPEIGHVL